MRRIRASPYSLIVVGLLATGYGIYLIKRGIEGDTLLPGTLFTYVPRWVFIFMGCYCSYRFQRRSGFFFTMQKLKQG